ncbi:hypothetical protein Q0T43_24945, partial [Escherichia coli O7:H6]
KAKKIEFSLTLERCDEDLRERLQSSSFGDLLGDFQKTASSAYETVGNVFSRA